MKEQSIKKLEVIGRGLTPMYEYFKTEESKRVPLEVIGRGLSPMFEHFPSKKTEKKSLK